MDWTIKALEFVTTHVPDIKHLWAFQPSWYRWVVYVSPILLALLLGGGMIYYRFNSPDRAAIERRISLDEGVDQLIRLRPEFQRAASALGQTPRLPGENDSVLLIGKTEVLQNVGMDAQQQAVVTPRGSVEVLVMVPFQDGSWAHRSATVFEGNTNPQTVLRQDAIRTRMQQAQHLVCVGLASRRLADVPAEIVALNTRLARLRAENLCSVAATVAGQGREYWALTLGHANNSAAGPIAEVSQRTAIIIGVTSVQPNDLEDALQTVVRGTSVRGIDLSAYSMSDDPELVGIEIDWTASGPLTDDPNLTEAE